MKRRLLITIRDIKGLLMEILCPIALVLVGLAISLVEMSFKSEKALIDIKILGNQNILFASNNPTINIQDYFINDISGVTSIALPNYVSNNNKQEAIYNFIEKVFEIEKDSEDSVHHEVDMTSDDYIGYYAALLLLEESNNKYEYIINLNTRIKHGIPIFCHYLSKAIIEKAAKHKVDITYTHYPLPLTYDLKDSISIGNNLAITFFTAIAFSLMPANFISILVKERINNSKHLMRLSGINIFSYWIVNYLFELIKYYFTGGVMILLIWAFDYYQTYLYIFYLIYGIAMVSFTYCISFLFNNESNAQNAIILINFIFGEIGSLIVSQLRTIKSVKNFGKVLEYIFAIVPSFCFNFGFNLMINRLSIYRVDYPGEWYYFKENKLLEEFNLLLSLIIYCSIENVLYTVLFIIIENFTYKFKKPSNKKLHSDINDSEVIKEIKRANYNNLLDKVAYSITEKSLSSRYNTIVEKLGLDETYAIRVNNLRKKYTSGFCGKKSQNILAIKNINFCVKHGECFGLLGLNGAGKTTTFKCITQELAQDNGSIYVNEKNTIGHFNELNELFGYCPQFDAIFEHLTVFENLEFYARIKGIKQQYTSLIVEAIIEEMSLDEFTNKISGKLSGGNKRKLSVAISMISNPPIILLDEPSTGMDPEARRYMWSVIHKMSTKGIKSSVIMTTHSMDEAETLCKRIAIMVNGEFVCFGKADQIKQKYGYGYEANVRIKPMSEKIFNNVLKRFNLDKNLLVDMNNIKEILNIIKKKFYVDELKEGRLGQKIIRNIELNGNINIRVLLSWIFFVANAIKFIIKGKKYFEEIILSEFIENNFLFKMKKGKSNYSIGFFFGLYEESKEKGFITEYSIQQTSLEQIFNKFSLNQGKNNNETEIINQEGDYDNYIIIDDVLVKKLIYK